MKKNLFLDFDGVPVNSIKAYCDVYNEVYKDHHEFKKANWIYCNDWSLEDQCPLSEKPKELFEHDEFFKRLEFYPGAKESLEVLKDQYNIIICTMGTLHNISKKCVWIQNNMPYIKDAIFISNKDCIDKSLIDMSGGIFIDDNSENLLASNADIKINYTHVKTYSWNDNWDGLQVHNWVTLASLLMQKPTNNLGLYSNVNRNS